MVFNKKLLWTIVIWFAMLQAISPFIHAHVEADSFVQGHGLHMHIQNLMQIQDDEHILKSVSAPVHTIGINNALVKSAESLSFPLFVVLFTISLLAVTIRLVRTNLIARPFLSLHLRSLSRPRAPPLF